ncbi:MAG: glycosyltransferase family 39 protein [Planctomycetaceae bacterium]|jgi:hypothetical protein|nr:glycosyltransferase family 39 protein [Planctomycetaceae bacterium]
MSFLRRFFVFLILVLGAGLLRFHCLGNWSFGYDELFTTLETKILFNEIPVPEEILRNTQGQTISLEGTQYYRLPRLLFASYVVHWLDYKLFGDDEFGSRVLMALMGSVGVGLVFLLAEPLFKTPTALLLAILLLLSPEHLLYSQYNRFYCQSFLLISVVLLLGAHVAVRHSVSAAFWLGPAAILMVFSNSFGGIIWGGLIGAVLADRLCSKNDAPKTSSVAIFLLLTLWSIFLFGIAVFHIVPLTSSWNAAASWGYTPVHAAMSFVNILGWTFFLLGFLGIGLALARIQTHGNAYWLVCAAASGFAVLLLPLKIVYNPFYGFLFTFPFFVTAALFLGTVYELLSRSEIPFARLLAVLWAFCCVLLNLPSVVSYYQDGNRPDNRAAFQYVAEHWQEGDRLTGFLMGTAQYYIPDKSPKIPLSTENTAAKLQSILDQKTNGNGRLWVVLTSSRGGLSNDLRCWLGQHALFKTRFAKKRFDYAENNVEVYLVTKSPPLSSKSP